MILKKAALNFIAGKIIKHFRMDKILKYVEEDNDLDISVRKLKAENKDYKIRIKRLEDEVFKK